MDAAGGEWHLHEADVLLGSVLPLATVSVRREPAIRRSGRFCAWRRSMAGPPFVDEVIL